MPPCPLGCYAARRGYCSGYPPRKLILISPWWEHPGIHSYYTCSCPVPNGATKRDMTVYRCDGYARWCDDPKAPPLHSLSRKNRNHIRKYA